VCKREKERERETHTEEEVGGGEGMYFSRGTTLIGSAAVLDSCSVSFLAVSSSLSPPPPPLPGAARKKPFPSTTSRIPYSRLLRRSFQLGAYSSSSRSLEQASFGRLRNGCLEERCGHASASVGSTGGERKKKEKP